MTYTAAEESVDNGSPIELYEFRYSNYVYYYTSGPDPVVRSNRTYTPIPISRTNINGSSEAQKQELRVRAPRTIEVAEWFRVAPPSEVVTLTIYRQHDTDVDGEFIVFWSGRVLNAEWTEDHRVEFMAESALTSMNRLGLKRRFGQSCPHEVYGQGCFANKNLHMVTATVTAVNGSTLATTAAHTEVDWYAGGYIEWDIPNSTAIEARAVWASTPDGVLTLSSFPVGLLPGMTIRAYAGCDHTLKACKTKFDNVINYGGFAFFPDKNPFGSNPVY